MSNFEDSLKAALAEFDQRTLRYTGYEDFGLREVLDGLLARPAERAPGIQSSWHPVDNPYDRVPVVSSPRCKYDALCTLPDGHVGLHYDARDGAAWGDDGTPYRPVVSSPGADSPDAEDAIDELENALVEYDERGDLFGTSGAGAYFLASFLVKRGWTSGRVWGPPLADQLAAQIEALPVLASRHRGEETIRAQAAAIVRASVRSGEQQCVACGENHDDGPTDSAGNYWCGECAREATP